MPSKARPNVTEISGIIEMRLAALAERTDNLETVAIEWRGKSINVPVITMPVDLLAYNPDTHRIRAQRETDPAGARALAGDPFGTEAQGYLHRLLMGDPKDPSKIDPSFTALQEDLRVHGQNDPGIITRAGVLINGNTRRAALKENSHEHIRVGILPSDASAEDVHGIELSLQLRQDHRREYSFMNYLLALDEQVAEGVPPTAIQKKFRILSTAFDRNLWILNFVRDAIKRSMVTTESGQVASLKLVDFESHKAKLEEVYRAFVAASKRSPDEGRALCEQRLLAILFDKSKTDLRLIQPDFVERYMKSVLPAYSDGPDVSIPGVSLKIPGDSANVRALQALTDSVLHAKSVASIGSKATPNELEAASQSMAELGRVLEKALDHAGRQDRLKQRKVAAADRISDACEDLDLAIEEVSRARAASQFEFNDVDEALLGLKSCLEKLGTIVARGEGSASDGVEWIKAVCAIASSPR